MEHLAVWNFIEWIIAWILEAIFGWKDEPEPEPQPASPPPKTVWQPMQSPRAREQLEPRQAFGPDPVPEPESKPRPQPALAPDDDEDEEMSLEMD